MAAAPQSPHDASAVAETASAWLARRDRGLTPVEQDAFLQWLQDDARHRTAWARLERTWDRLDRLEQWRPAHSQQPNPDLLATNARSRRVRLWFSLGGVAAAAGLILGFFLLRPASPPVAKPLEGLRVIPAPERVVLDDGSVVEANRGGVFQPAFSASERRVRLVEGEAHFTVAKSAARPFVVEVAGVAVRAIGTAFNVRQSASAVDVLVTEGRVRVEMQAAPAAPPTALGAGELARINPTQPTSPPVVTTLTPAQIDSALAWQGVRLDFDGLPLSAAVAEFNLRNRQKLVIGDPRIGSLRVAGSFRADNVEGFARLLQASFGVAVERCADGTLLLRREG